MALTISEFATGSTTTSVTSIDISSLTAAVGDMLVVAVSSDNSGTNGASPISSVTDSASNTYTSRVNIVRSSGAAANDGVALRVFTGAITAALSSGTITVNFSTSTGNANVLIWRVEASGDATISFKSDTNTTLTGSGTTATRTHNTGVPQAIFGFIATEAGGTFTAASDSAGGNWSSNYVSNTATETPLASQYKIPNAVASPSYSPSWASTADYAIGTVQVNLVESAKLYLPSSSSAPAISPTVDADWDKSTDLDRVLASKTTTASTMTTITSIKDVDNTAYDIVRRQYIYGPLAAQTIEGSVLGVIRASESNLAADATSQLGIRVVSNDGSAVRGTALALGSAALSSEWSTSLITRFFPQGTTIASLSSVTAEAGDYLVIEVGVRGREASATSRTFSWRVGDAAASDNTLSQGASADGRPYLLFYGPKLALTTLCTPGTASLAITRFAPDVTTGGGGTNTTASPAAGTLTSTAYAPSVTATDNKTFSPGVATLAATPDAPVVTTTANVSAEPGSISATLTAHSPAVSTSANQVAAPATATLTVTVFAAVVSATDSKTVTPAAASLTTAAAAPSLALRIEAGTAALTATPQAPTVTEADRFTPGTRALTLTRYAPTVSLTDNRTVTPQAAALALVAFVPLVINAAPIPGMATSRITATGFATHTLTAPEASVSLVATAEASLTLSSGGT